MHPHTKADGSIGLDCFLRNRIVFGTPYTDIDESIYTPNDLERMVSAIR